MRKYWQFQLTKLIHILNINNYTDLPEILIKKIAHFFERYKDLEEGKWVKVSGWKDFDHAQKLIQVAIDRYNDEKN